MTLYEFKALDEKEQRQMIWSAGVKVARRKDNAHEYILSQIDLFYVEEKICLFFYLFTRREG